MQCTGVFLLSEAAANIMLYEHWQHCHHFSSLYKQTKTTRELLRKKVNGKVSGNYPESLVQPPTIHSRLSPTQHILISRTSCQYSSGAINVQRHHQPGCTECAFCLFVSFVYPSFFFKSFYFYFLIAQDMVSACWTNPFPGRTASRSSCLEGYTMSINSVNWYLGQEHRCALIW